MLGGGRGVDPALLDELEALLFTSDIGVRTADRLLTLLRERHASDRLTDMAAVVSTLRDEITSILELPSADLFEGATTETPRVLMVVGVNGVGKTTTIGKLAHFATQQGHQVLLGAGDTFRAAAVDQLGVWAERTGATLVEGKSKSDPSSVLFDAVRRGHDEGASVIICDTAGRLHTRKELMDELEKMHRSIAKAAPGAPHEVILVLDATIGQNAIAQAKTFRESTPLTGIILTKLDGTARGGVIVGICDELKVPVKYIGVGEALEDLRSFDAGAFVDALFSELALDSE